MDFQIESPKLTDIEELLNLYYLIYGNSYPIAYGTDPRVMAETMNSPDHNWLVCKAPDSGVIVGSVIYEIDRINKIGKVVALVTHPGYRKKNIASRMISHGDQLLLGDAGPLNSIYTTTRTVSVGPQLAFLRQGYLPIGIFPNAHKLRQYETTTLMAKYRPAALQKRNPPEVIPAKLKCLYEIVQQSLRLESIPKVLEAPSAAASGRYPGPDLDFEIIFAPTFAERRFLQTFNDPYDRFFPFHSPNLLMASTNGEIEIYAHLSKADRYCTIIALTQPTYTLAGRFQSLLDHIRDQGVSYLEVLIGVEHTQSIETLLNMQFLPSALYPGMRESNGRTYDFVVMTRTLEPLNFRGMEIDRSFKPYIDQYIDLWKRMHLEALQIYNGDL